MVTSLPLVMEQNMNYKQGLFLALRGGISSDAPQ